MKHDTPPAAQCTACHRKSWSKEIIGKWCMMPQPGGRTCPGIMKSFQPKGHG